MDTFFSIGNVLFLLFAAFLGYRLLILGFRDERGWRARWKEDDAQWYVEWDEAEMKDGTDREFLKMVATRFELLQYRRVLHVEKKAHYTSYFLSSIVQKWHADVWIPTWEEWTREAHRRGLERLFTPMAQLAEEERQDVEQSLAAYNRRKKKVRKTAYYEFKLRSTARSEQMVQLAKKK